MKLIEVLELTILAMMFWFVATWNLPTNKEMERAVEYHGSSK